MKKFIVTKSKWGRGRREGYLLDEDGTMCCLGFCLLQSGLTEEEISLKRMPRAVSKAVAPFSIPSCTPSLMAFDTHLSEDAARINDNTSILDEDRIGRLKELFARHDLELEFVE